MLEEDLESSNCLQKKLVYCCCYKVFFTGHLVRASNFKEVYYLSKALDLNPT
jgi:hypothetical protein